MGNMRDNQIAPEDFEEIRHQDLAGIQSTQQPSQTSTAHLPTYSSDQPRLVVSLYHPLDLVEYQILRKDSLVPMTLSSPSWGSLGQAKVPLYRSSSMKARTSRSGMDWSLVSDRTSVISWWSYTSFVYWFMSLTRHEHGGNLLFQLQREDSRIPSWYPRLRRYHSLRCGYPERSRILVDQRISK